MKDWRKTFAALPGWLSKGGGRPKTLKHWTDFTCAEQGSGQPGLLTLDPRSLAVGVLRTSAICFPCGVAFLVPTQGTGQNVVDHRNSVLRSGGLGAVQPSCLRSTSSAVFIHEFPHMLFLHHKGFMNASYDKYSLQILRYGILEVRARWGVSL